MPLDDIPQPSQSTIINILKAWFASIGGNPATLETVSRDETVNLLFNIFKITAAGTGGGGGAAQNLNQVMLLLNNIDNTNGSSDLHSFLNYRDLRTFSGGNLQYKTWENRPFNYNSTYANYEGETAPWTPWHTGRAGFFNSGWTAMENSNGIGRRPNIVFDIFAYNMAGVGTSQRNLQDEAAARYGFETHFEGVGGGPVFESHFPQITRTNGDAHRPNSLYINKVTGYTQWSCDVDNFQLNERYNASNFFFAASGGKTHIRPWGPNPNLTFEHVANPAVPNENFNSQMSYTMSHDPIGGRTFHNQDFIGGHLVINCLQSGRFRFNDYVPGTDFGFTLDNNVSGLYGSLGIRKFGGQVVFSVLENGETGIGISNPSVRLHVVKRAGHLTPAIIQGCDTYADDTAAGAAGLTEGMLYKKADGTLMVKL